MMEVGPGAAAVRASMVDLNVNQMSLDVSGAPSLHFIFGRRWKVTDFASGAISQLEAKRGWRLQSSATVRSLSRNSVEICWSMNCSVLKPVGLAWMAMCA